MGDSIGRRDEIRVFIGDLVSVVLGDDSDGGRLDCSGIRSAPVVFIRTILNGLVDAVRGWWARR